MAKEISALALQYGQGDRGPPKRHRNGTERAFQSPSREIPALAMQKGEGSTRRGASRRYPSMTTDSGSVALEHGETSVSHPGNRPPAPARKTPMANMVHMRRTPEERASANMPILSDETNHGMTFEMAEPELEKLGLEDMPDRGDVLHFTAMANVVSINDDQGGKRVRLEIIAMKVHNEMAEDEEEEHEEMGMSDDDRMKNRYGEEEEHY